MPSILYQNIKFTFTSFLDAVEFHKTSNIKIKELKDGSTIILSNGAKKYYKNIKSNLDKDNYIYFNSMTASFGYIDEKDSDKYFITKGCFVFRLNDEYRDKVILKYMFYCLEARHKEEFRKLLHGSCQKFVSIGAFKESLNLCPII